MLVGAFFSDYSVDYYSSIRITEHTEYQFPKEQTLWYFENRITDVTKIKEMRPRKSSFAFFPSKDRRKLSKEHDYTVHSVCFEQTAIPSISSILLSGTELTEYYSVQSGIEIGPKRTQFTSGKCVSCKHGICQITSHAQSPHSLAPVNTGKWLGANEFASISA